MVVTESTQIPVFHIVDTRNKGILIRFGDCLGVCQMASGKVLEQPWLLPSVLFPGVYSRSFLPLKNVSGQIGEDLKFGTNDTIWDLGYQ